MKVTNILAEMHDVQGYIQEHEFKLREYRHALRQLKNELKCALLNEGHVEVLTVDMAAVLRIFKNN